MKEEEGRTKRKEIKRKIQREKKRITQNKTLEN